MKARTVGWATGALVALGGTGAVLALGSDSRTLVVRTAVLGAVGLTGAIAGVSASCINRALPESGMWGAAAGSALAGMVIGAFTFLILETLAYLAIVIAFVNSSFVW